MPKQKFSPLPAAAFQILMSLVDDDLHGYEIMRRVEEQTARPHAARARHALQLHPGLARSRVHRRSLAPRSAADANDERRRYYRVTAAGRKAGREEAERLADLLRVARAKKILKGEYV